jgi:hypothetical protein
MYPARCADDAFVGQAKDSILATGGRIPNEKVPPSSLSSSP